MKYTVIITAYRRDIFETLPNLTFEFEIFANSVEEATEWAYDKAKEVEYYPDKHIEFCDYKVKQL